MIAASSERVIEAARAWLGTPYHDQQSVRGVGCDCLGLIRGVWQAVVGPEPEDLPPYTRDWGEARREEVIAIAAQKWLLEIDKNVAGAGAVGVFRMRKGAIAKHMGILTADDTIIHAYEKAGVIEEKFTKAWRRRMAYAFLFPGDFEWLP